MTQLLRKDVGQVVWSGRYARFNALQYMRHSAQCLAARRCRGKLS
ncbi:MAG TPA: hypothetical protein VMI52_00950 [Acetobacteraceae bacterium]|nr:hypothetical protein [Acetobacteraceae bacterium]